MKFIIAHKRATFILMDSDCLSYAHVLFFFKALANKNHIPFYSHGFSKLIIKDIVILSFYHIFILSFSLSYFIFSIIGILLFQKFEVFLNIYTFFILFLSFYYYFYTK